VGSMTNVRDLAKAGAYKLATKGKMTVKSTTPNVCTVKGVSVVGVASGQCSLLVKVGSAKAVRVRASVAS
jgi:predicted house-cleaning NTP pyrophosphatase (Maf/HAM1 superfamily)